VDEAPASGSLTWMLVGRPDDHERELLPLRTREVLAAVARRGVPSLVEATLVPTLLFLVVSATLGAAAAMASVLAWGFGAIGRRLLLGHRIPTILVLATVGLTVRTVVGLASGSTFAYFVQPVATTVVLAGIFAGSVVVGRPAIARLAHDFCPLEPTIAGRPAIARLFTGLTLLWAGVHLATAATTFGMLVSLPVPMFVALKTAASAAITVSAVAVTVMWALHTARREDLVFTVV